MKRPFLQKIALKISGLDHESEEEEGEGGVWGEGGLLLRLSGIPIRPREKQLSACLRQTERLPGAALVCTCSRGPGRWVQSTERFLRGRGPETPSQAPAGRQPAVQGNRGEQERHRQQDRFAPWALGVSAGRSCSHAPPRRPSLHRVPPRARRHVRLCPLPCGRPSRPLPDPAAVAEGGGHGSESCAAASFLSHMHLGLEEAGPRPAPDTRGCETGACLSQSLQFCCTVPPLPPQNGCSGCCPGALTGGG